ncbi:RHS repeat-associated core domain-containing protein [Kitasatospora sp. NPDC051984]|uniref:RHS repeat-associated core domain-containing protein n=1 Tax=Kitasatospora sp. NPDC051984 TaxID=3364059 RepID=UPI0037C774E9
MSDGFKHNHEETEKLAEHFKAGSSRLTSAGDTHLGRARHHFGRTRGRGGLAQAAEAGVEQLIESITKGQKALGKHLGDVGTGLKKTSANHRAHEQELTRTLSSIAGGKGTPKGPGGGKPSYASVLGGGNGTNAPKPGPPKPGPPKPGPRPGPPPMRLNNTRPKVQGKPLTTRPAKSDPVDIATGDVLFPQTDVGLDAALPLVLSRTHMSSYRLGGWYGPSWASTLDQRIELDGEGVLFAAEDGMLLSYPVPEPGGAVLPVEGPRWPLHWDSTPGGEIRITDPHSGLTRHFAEPAGGPGPHARAAGTLQLPLLALTDRNGHRVEVVYGSGGVPVEVRHSGGYRIGVTSEGPRITALALLPHEGTEDEPVELVRYGYDGNGRLATVTDSSRIAMSLTYDGSGRLTSWTDRVGYRYRYVYDRAGRCVQTRGDGGYLDAVFSYDDEQRVTTMTDAVGNRTVYQFDEAGRLERETSPHGAVATFQWDRYGSLLSRTDPLGRTTGFSYDEAGNLEVSTLPDGTTSSASYNERHQVTELTAMDGAQWRYEYDEHGNTVATIDPMGARTAYSFDEYGRPVAVTDALGNTSRVTFDAAGLTTSLTEATGATSHSTRDAFGRLNTVTDALGNTTSFGWTLEGRPAWRQDPDGGRHEWTHDAQGRVIAYRDPAGGVTRAEYGPFGKLTARTGPGGDRWTFEYDGQLRLTAVTNPVGERWTYRHDPTGGVIEETDFAGRTVRYERDLTGVLTARTNAAGQRVEYVRDAQDRTVEMHADGRVTRYTYDGAGRVLTVGDGTTGLSRRYDPTGRLIAEECEGRVTTFSYDLLGRRTGLRTPAGAESHWTYTPIGLPETLTAPGGALRFHYDRAGREVRREFGQVVFDRRYDAMDRLTGQQVGAEGRLVSGQSWAFRPGGALAETTDHLLGTRTTGFDGRGKVTELTGANWREGYLYDPAGDLVGLQLPGSGDESGELTVAGGRPRQAGRTSYEYDAQGRLVRRTRRLLSGGEHTWQYTWDSHDQLTSVALPDGTLARYRYDAFGRRRAKQLLAADRVTVLDETLFTWANERLVEQVRTRADRPGRHVTAWEWTLTGQRPLTQTDWLLPAADAPQHEIDRRFHAIVTDLVGSPTELVDEHGAVAWQQRTTLWGRPLPGAIENVGCPLRFPGQYHDAETGLHYNVFRYYDPATAHYLSPDPLGLAGGANPYGYVNDPRRISDPLGLDPDLIDLYHGTTHKGATSVEQNGINPQHSPRPMDFGHGGFYVTNDPKQARDWANTQDERYPTHGGPAVMHFQVSRSELEALNGKRFNNDQELADFIAHHRNDRYGRQMHDYDNVEGKMLMNLRPWQKDNTVPMRLRGHQIAFYQQPGVDLLSNGYIGRHRR